MADELFSKGKTWAERQAERQRQQEQGAPAGPEAMTTETIRIPRKTKDRAEAKARALGVKRTRLLRWIIEQGLAEVEAGNWQPPTREMVDI